MQIIIWNGYTAGFSETHICLEKVAMSFMSQKWHPYIDCVEMANEIDINQTYT